MKKKIFLLFIMILSFLSLSDCQNIQEQNNMIEYQSGNYHDKNWNDMVGTYSEPVILDKETAVEVAKAIFNGMNTSENMNGHVPKSIFYD